jgi:hypothetical protein
MAMVSHLVLAIDKPDKFFYFLHAFEITAILL